MLKLQAAMVACLGQYVRKQYITVELFTVRKDTVVSYLLSSCKLLFTWVIWWKPGSQNYTSNHLSVCGYGVDSHVFFFLLPQSNNVPVDGLYGHLLSVADEEGSVRLLDTRKPATRAVCKGISLIRFSSPFDSKRPPCYACMHPGWWHHLPHAYSTCTY